MLKYFIISVSMCMLYHHTDAQTGNHVFTGAEAVIFDTVDLATPGEQAWSTDRMETPGYFSAMGNTSYTGVSDDANVDGYVKLYVDGSSMSSYLFPVGTGTDLRSLSISGSIPLSGVFATSWILGDPGATEDPTAPFEGLHSTSSVGAGITSISPAGQWDWQDISGNAAGIIASVSIPDVTDFAAASDLRLVGWNGSEWTNLSEEQGAVAASGNTENSSLTGTMTDGITALAIGSVNAPLPVRLLRFTARVTENCKVIISWSTGSETGLERFELESGVDGSTFTPIASIEAMGSGSNYIYEHMLNTGTFIYYRLKMTDLDQTVTSSKIILLSPDCSDYITTEVYPTLTEGIVHLNHILEGEEVAVYNVAGELVLQSVLSYPIAQLDLSSYPSGPYNIVIITLEKERKYYKIVRQ